MVQGRKRVGHLSKRVIENVGLRPIEVRRKQAIFRRVVAQREQQRVRHVGLKAERLRTVHHLQQLDHVLPAMHAAPADFALGRQPLAVCFGDGAGFAEGFGDAAWSCQPDPSPHSAGLDGGIDADDAILPDADLLAASARSRRPCAPARQSDSAPRRCPSPTRRRSAATPARRPSRSRRFRAATRSASRFRSSSLESMLTCGSNRNRSTPSKRDAVDLGRGREIEHRVEIDGRLGVRALSDQSRPHGVVERRISLQGGTVHD